MYHEPNGYRKVNREELDYIKEGGGLTEVSDAAGRISWADFVQLLKYRKLVGLYIGQFAVASTLFFFLTWFPTYLAEAKHMAFLKVGFAASIPYIAAFSAYCSAGIGLTA